MLTKLSSISGRILSASSPVIRSRRITVPPDTLTRLDPVLHLNSELTFVVSNWSDVICELGGSGLVLGQGYEFLPGEAIPITTTGDSQGLYALSNESLDLQIVEAGTYTHTSVGLIEPPNPLRVNVLGITSITLVENPGSLAVIEPTDLTVFVEAEDNTVSLDLSELTVSI